MKKITALLMVFIGISLTPAQATDTYDSVWYNSSAGYITAHESNGAVVYFKLEDFGDTAYVGTRSGDRATVQIVGASPEITIINEVFFQSATTATVTLVTCSPSYYCSYPVGTVFSFQRIF